MTARQQTKIYKYGLFYFPLDDSVAQCATSRIIDGKGHIRVGNMVRIKWDHSNPNVPAKIIKLADTNLEISKAEKDVDISSIQLSGDDQAFMDAKAKDETERPNSGPQICTPAKDAQKSSTANVTELDSYWPDNEPPRSSTPIEVAPETENSRCSFDQNFTSSRPSEISSESSFFSLDSTLPGGITNFSGPFPWQTLTSDHNIPVTNRRQELGPNKQHRGDILLDLNDVNGKISSIQSNLGQINDSLVRLNNMVYTNGNFMTQIIKNQNDIMIKLDTLFSGFEDNRPSTTSTSALGTPTQVMSQHQSLDSTGSEAPLKLSPEKLMKLKEMSKSKSNFAVVLLKAIFSKEERMGRSVFGKRKSKPKLCELKLSQVNSYFFQVYPAATEKEEKEVWQQCVNSMNQHLKKYNKPEPDASQNSSHDVSMESIID